MNLKMKRLDLIEQLESRLEWAKEYDAKRLAEHKAAEKAYYTGFKAACREAAKWDYATAKKNSFGLSFNTWENRAPQCPWSTEAEILRVLPELRVSSQASFTIPSGRLHFILTYDETVANLKTEMC